MFMGVPGSRLGGLAVHRIVENCAGYQKLQIFRGWRARRSWAFARKRVFPGPAGSKSPRWRKTPSHARARRPASSGTASDQEPVTKKTTQGRTSPTRNAQGEGARVYTIGDPLARRSLQSNPAKQKDEREGALLPIQSAVCKPASAMGFRFRSTSKPCPPTPLWSANLPSVAT